MAAYMLPCARVRVQVQPLNGGEWGACFAIGIGAIPYSWTVRIMLRFFYWAVGDRSVLEILRGQKAVQRSNSGRTMSGRNMSGRYNNSGRSSIRVSGGSAAGVSPKGKVAPWPPADTPNNHDGAIKAWQ